MHFMPARSTNPNVPNHVLVTIDDDYTIRITKKEAKLLLGSKSVSKPQNRPDIYSHCLNGEGVLQSSNGANVHFQINHNLPDSIGRSKGYDALTRSENLMIAI